MKTKDSNRCICYIIIVVGILMVLCGCYDDKPQGDKYYTDVSFVKEKFPKIKKIESVKYTYIEDYSRDIGLKHPKFEGVVYLNKTYAKNIRKKYKWKIASVKASDSLVDNDIRLLYNEKFNQVMHTNSFVGCFYYCKELGMIYFKGEY